MGMTSKLDLRCDRQNDTKDNCPTGWKPMPRVGNLSHRLEAYATCSNDKKVSRRSMIAGPVVASSSIGVGCLLSAMANAEEAPQGIAAEGLSTYRYCLNTSTIHGEKLPIRQQLKIAAEAGYDSIELWVRDIEKFVAEGGKLTDLAKELSDLGMTLDSAIAFGKWIVNDPVERAAGLEQCRRDMDLVRTLGGKRMAAPPAGASQEHKLDLNEVAQRYRALLEIGKGCEVIPQLELWGFSLNLSTLAEVLFVAAAADHPDACLLLDVYHLYKGGSDFRNIGLVPGANMHCLHMNDYPATPDRPVIADKDRVYPGDGIAPIADILRSLRRSGFAGTLSLELFNPNYWQEPPELVARTGLEKMKRAVEKSF